MLSTLLYYSVQRNYDRVETEKEIQLCIPVGDSFKDL